MGLIVCFACGRQKEIKPLKKGATYFCSNCGAKEVIIFRSRKHAKMVSWTEKEGVDGEKARHRTYAGLRRFAEHKGFKKAKGWCAHKFREIFGRWPNGEAAEDAAPASAQLLKWIRQQGKQYAKQRKEMEALVNGISLRTLDNVDLHNTGNVDSSTLMTEEDWRVKL